MRVGVCLAASRAAQPCGGSRQALSTLDLRETSRCYRPTNRRMRRPAVARDPDSHPRRSARPGRGHRCRRALGRSAASAPTAEPPAGSGVRHRPRRHPPHPRPPRQDRPRSARRREFASRLGQSRARRDTLTECSTCPARLVDTDPATRCRLRVRTHRGGPVAPPRFSAAKVAVITRLGTPTEPSSGQADAKTHVALLVPHFALLIPFASRDHGQEQESDQRAMGGPLGYYVMTIVIGLRGGVLEVLDWTRRVWRQLLGR